MLDWIPIDWVIGALLIATLLYVYLTWNYDHWKKRGIYYEKPSLFFGNYGPVFTFKKTVGTHMHEIYNKLDDLPYVGLFRFRSPALLIRDPEIIKLILVKEFPSFDKNAFIVNSEMDPLFARSPFISTGSRWKRDRSLLSPSFTSGKLKPLFPLMEEVADKFEKYLEIQAPRNRPDGLEAKELCCKYTTDVVASCAFGVDAKCLEDEESEFRAINRKLNNPDFFTNVRFLINMFFPSITGFLKIRLMPLEVANFYRSLVKNVMKHREANNETRNDFLQLLMQIKLKSQEKKDADNSVEYTDEDVTAHAITFLTEGFETSSITMSFLLYELAMNSAVQDKLRDELQEALEKNEGKFTLDVINSLPYLHMIFSETLRMHPPLMTMEKFCTKKCQLPKKNGGSFEVEPGTLILIPAHALHYDPKYYPNPNKFDPERFSEERKETIRSYTYLPFGEGPRICIGMRFAQVQVKIGVARVVLNYDIRPTAKTPRKIVQDINYFLAAAEGGLWLDFIKRQ